MASSDLQNALDLMTGRWRSQILHAGVKLGVFHAIGSSTHNADQLAETLALDPNRIMTSPRPSKAMRVMPPRNW